MSSAGTTSQEDTAALGAPARAASVLYVCVERGTAVPGTAAERAKQEGIAFAEDHQLAIAEVVTDDFGEPDPRKRPGWQRVRELAAAGAVTTVLLRWPTALAPDSAHEHRYQEVRWLRDHGARVLYTWAPLAAVRGRAA
jgi:hypothetical protein